MLNEAVGCCIPAPTSGGFVVIGEWATIRNYNPEEEVIIPFNSRNDFVVFRHIRNSANDSANALAYSDESIASHFDIVSDIFLKMTPLIGGEDWGREKLMVARASDWKVWLFQYTRDSSGMFNDRGRSSIIGNFVSDEWKISFLISPCYLNGLYPKNEKVRTLQFGECALRNVGSALGRAGGAQSGMSSFSRLPESSAHIVSLYAESDQLKQKNEKRDYADSNLIPSILNKFVIVRSFDLSLYLLFFSFGLLFSGGNNIYRERFFWGAAMIGLGGFLGFNSLVSGGSLL
jgi:hypothetical protein